MPIVYAWKLKEGLCYEAVPIASLLKDNYKPSPEAKKTKCYLMEYGDYLKLKKAAKEG